ncbi:hypothetical protein ACTQ31_08720 [Clostridium butyricum]|uniref:hypothetical protein n=1 Tax=Clostridium butyricum TaxID=1492 RepID=UPI003F90D97B
MLQEKLNECRLLIEEVSRNKQIDQNNKNIAKKNNTFFDAYINLFVPCVKSYNVAIQFEEIEFSESTIKEMKYCIKSAKDTFENKIVVNPAKFNAEVKKLNEKIAGEWNKKTTEIMADISENLSILKLVCNNKREIQNILYCINNFSNWPVTEENLNNYKKARKRADEILETMEFDDEIEEFLKKVKDKEASLLDLTDSIIEWIRREDLSKNIMLSIKN